MVRITAVAEKDTIIDMDYYLNFYTPTAKTERDYWEDENNSIDWLKKKEEHLWHFINEITEFSNGNRDFLMGYYPVHEIEGWPMPLILNPRYKKKFLEDGTLLISHYDFDDSYNPKWKKLTYFCNGYTGLTLIEHTKTKKNESLEKRSSWQTVNILKSLINFFRPILDIAKETYYELRENTPSEYKLYEDLPWMQSIDNFQIEVSNSFKKDWKDITGCELKEIDMNLVKLTEFLIKLHNVDHHTYSNIETPSGMKHFPFIRKLYFNIAMSKKGKIYGNRVYFCLYKKSRLIYLLTIASQTEFNKITQDTKAISIATDTAKEKGELLGERPA